MRPSDHSDRLGEGELTPERGERFEAEHPDAFMRRREFLTRTAALAGGAALAGTLPVETLVAEATRRAGLRPLPKPRDLPIDTFVVLMMENRSFDHYFGWHPVADARNEGLTYPDGNGNELPTYRLTPDFQGCGHPDPDHGWDGGRWQWHGGRNDRFVTGNEEGTGSDEFAIGYYEKEDVGFIPHAADAFTLYDRWFCSIMASTYPNRHYQWGAQNGGQKSNVLPPESEEQTGFTWETIFDRAEKHGVSVGYYNSDLPFSALYGQRGLGWTRPIADFYVQAAAGTLPNICFVDPPFRDGGGGDGTSADEHPHGDIRLGQAFMSDVAHAFLESPQYERGVLFIDYDEWGGFFDHVKPRFVPDDRSNPRDIDNDWSMTGFRTPGVAISPYTRRGGVSSLPVTHESILKLIAYRYRLGYLNKRHRHASNIGRTFNFRRKNMEPPELPDPTAIAATPCSLQNGQTAGQARPKPHDLALLESTGYLDELGYQVRPATYDQIFRDPDSVRTALEGSTSR
jgi:phospholipase C